MIRKIVLALILIPLALVIVALAVANSEIVTALGDVVSHLAAGSIVPSNLAQPLGDSMRTREPVVIESRAERSGRYPMLGRYSESGSSDGAFVVVPFVEHDESYGAMLLAFTDNRVFSDDERAYIATLGRLGGQAIARASNYGAV